MKDPKMGMAVTFGGTATILAAFVVVGFEAAVVFGLALIYGQITAYTWGRGGRER